MEYAQPQEPGAAREKDLLRRWKWLQLLQSVLQRKTLAGSCKAYWEQEQAYIHKIKRSKIKSPNWSAAHAFVSACILWSSSALRMRWPPPKNSFTTGVWHPSGDTFAPSTPAARSSMLCKKTLPAQSLYMEENESLASKSLALPGFASVFPRGTMHRAVDQRAVC